MISAFQVLLPAFVTMALGYAAAWHGRFGEEQVPILNKVVLLYTIPMSVSVGILRTKRALLVSDAGLLLVLLVALTGVFLVGVVLIRFVVGRDLATSTLRALAIAFPAVPFVGPSLLTPLFGSTAPILIAAGSLVGNIVLMPITMVCLSVADGEAANPGASVVSMTAAQTTPRGDTTVSSPTGEKVPTGGVARSQTLWTSLRHALVHELRQPLVWGPTLSLIIVLLGVNTSNTFDNSLQLMGLAAGGVGLFTTGIVLQSQHASLSPSVIASVVGKNLLTPLVTIGAAYLLGQSGSAMQLAVTASIFTAPIVVTLAVEHGVDEGEMSSTLLLSALLCPLTTGLFIALATR